MLIDNPKRISAEEIPDEQQQTVLYLAEILNYFMEQVTNTVNGNLGYDNFRNKLVTLNVTVDSSGVPIGSNKFSSELLQVRGHKVVGAVNVTNSTTYPTSAPFLIFESNGQGVFTVKKILGLPANNKFQLLIELIP